MNRNSYLPQPGAKEVPALAPGTVPMRVASPPPSAEQPETARSRLLDRWLPVGRIAWIGVAVLTLSLFVASIGPRYDQFANPPASVRHALDLLHVSVGVYAAYNIGLELLLAVVFSAVALVIYWRKSHDAVALVVAFMLLLAGSAMRPIVSTMDALIGVQPILEMPINVLTYLTWFHVVAFFCLFPDGRFTPRWTRWLLIIAGLLLIPWDLFPRSPLSPWKWPAPAFVALELALWGSCLAAQVQRYRTLSNRVQRQQTKWVVFGASTTLIAGLGFYFPRVLDPALNQPGTATNLLYDLGTLTGMYLAVLLTPLAIGISILRYRLWGIDVLINRTLVYVPLTAILAGVYSASIALFQKVFLALTGDKSDAAIVITTLILATLFTPVKNALQSFVDKRYKETPDPARLLKAFAEHVQSEIDVIDPQRVSRRLLEEAAEAFEAETGAIFLAPDTTTPTYTVGKWMGTAALTMPLVSGEVTLGRLLLGPRRYGVEYTAPDRANLQATVDVVAAAVASAPAPEEHLVAPGAEDDRQSTRF